MMMMMMIMMMLVLVLMMMMLMHCSREAKHRLEMDWSDKYSAQHLGKWRLIYLDVS